MTPLLALQLYLVVGLVFGASCVVQMEAQRLAEGRVPLRRNTFFYFLLLSIGALAWPVGLVQYFRRTR